MASIKIVLKSNQPRKDGTIPVLIRVTAGRRSKYFSTGYSVKETQFREGSENWVIKHPDAILINAAIEAKRSKIAEKVYLADIEGTSIDIDEIGSKKSKGTFFTAIKIKMNSFESRNQVASYNRLHAKLKIIGNAWGKDVHLSDIGPKWVNKYVSYRIQEGCKVSTIKKDLSDFSGVLNSIESYNGKDWFNLAQKTLKAEPPVKEKLTLQEIKELEKAPLSGLNDIARDMFLFAFYCQGMRFQNVATFQKSMIKNGMIRYRMNKGKKVREIEIHPKLKNIIDKYHGSPYMFPVVKKEITDNWNRKYLIDSANALINANLKRVAIIAGVEKSISMHIARHSFAFLTKERGVNTEIIKDALGHSTSKMTEVYLQSLSDKDINEAVKGLYD